MAEYVLLVKPSVQKELLGLTKVLVKRLIPKIEALAVEPRPQGCTKLTNMGDLWRIRVGDYRVVYAIDDLGRVVEVMRVAHRREVYNG